jgi:copper chaperone NosL
VRRTLAIGLVLFAACSAASLAAQLVARGEEPRFFDDIGCLRDFLSRGRAAKAAVAFVADHRTRQWVRADRAVYTRARIETPMGSRLIAHANAASRDADPASAGGRSIAATEVLGPAGGEGLGRREAR